jgi:hypothetical protein
VVLKHPVIVVMTSFACRSQHDPPDTP